MEKVRLILADVDGTLVTREKVLTERARNAVRKMGEAGIAFAITSGRPPRGMQMLIEPLGLTTPIAAFNGGLFVRNDLSVIEQRVLGREAVETTVEIITANKLDVWIYRGSDWFVHERHGPHVDREEWTVKFPPTVLADFSGVLDGVAKVVGVSDDLEAVARCEKAVQERFAGGVLCWQSDHGCQPSPPTVSAARSQPYYLDVTHPDANKGGVVVTLSRMLGIPAEQIGTIGDMPNDVPMFKKSGFSIAMGQASDEVKKAATHTTDSCDEEGFAKAMERYVLNNVSAQEEKS